MPWIYFMCWKWILLSLHSMKGWTFSCYQCHISICSEEKFDYSLEFNKRVYAMQSWKWLEVTKIPWTSAFTDWYFYVKAHSPTKHGLIEMAKRPTDHGQKSRSLFVSQVTKHLLETMLIKKAHQSLLCSHTVQNAEKINNDFSNLPNSAAFCMNLMKMECVYLCGWVKTIYMNKFHSMKLLWNRWSTLWQIRAWSSMMLTNNVPMEWCNFCCHPNYKSNGEWYDWLWLNLTLVLTNHFEIKNWNVVGQLFSK